ncbi:MAG: Sua5/YciO/YrdC/YwlC family protein, partial [Cyanobacteria bacterium P01_C01_bin.118]
TSAHTGDMDEAYFSRYELFDALEKQVDIIIDSEADPSYLASTILDMTDDEPVILRKGLGFDAVEQFAMTTAA